MSNLSTQSVTVTHDRSRFTVSLLQPVHAAPEVIWAVMSDHGGYADVADNLSHVELLTPEGPEMRRRCAGAKGETWEETCTSFNPGTSFGFRVHTEAEDYPYPFSQVEGHWEVVTSGDTTGFRIDITAAPKGNWLAQKLVLLLALPKFRKVMADLGTAWAARMEREARATKDVA